MFIVKQTATMVY